MSMTESEALEVFNSGCNDIYKVQVATHTAIKALSEIQQYRAIGTVSEFREAMFFKKYFMELYGEGLEVANWHLNGDLELLDNIIDEAVERGKQEESGEHDE